MEKPETFKNTGRVVREKLNMLSQTDLSFGSIYRVMFSKPNFVMMETSTTFGGIKTYTYGESDRIIGQLAAGIASTGRKGRYIGLYGENCPEWIFLFWAVLRSGNYVFPVNLRQPQSFSQSMLDTLNAECIVSAGACDGFHQQVLSYQELLERGTESEIPSDDAFADEIALCTSGTTLREKICFFSGKEFASLILTTKEIIRRNKTIKRTYRGRVKMLVVLPLYHVFGLEATYFWFSFFGVSFVFPENMSPDILLRTIREHEVTHILCVPALWHTVEKLVRREVAKRGEETVRRFEKGLRISLALQSLLPFTEQAIPARLFREIRKELFGDSVHFCISGGSALRVSASRLMNGIGYPLFNGYGMTEIGIASANFARRAKERLNPSFGNPFSCVRFRIGEDRHLLVSGSSVCKAILVDGKREQTGKWFDTGDMVELDVKGRYVLCGRASDVVIGEGGENLNPELAETAFELTSAQNFAVLGDEKMEKLQLICQISDQMVGLQKEKLLKDIERGKASLPLTYRISDVFFTYDPIMEPSDIKVSRSKLRRMISGGSVRLFDSLPLSDERDSENGDSEVKSILRGMFADILDVEPESIRGDAHFMNDLGASSLEYIMLVNRIQERFDVNVAFEEEGFGYSLNDFTKIVESLICL
ncbi:MAG: AMP-binding protein [Clostridia bacterium]|nr:AMP-binding protein [Clostridia bacterium]